VQNLPHNLERSVFLQQASGVTWWRALMLHHEVHAWMAMADAAAGQQPGQRH
jgi:hypothetical protein